MNAGEAWLALRKIKYGIDTARLIGVDCAYPAYVAIDGVQYGFSGAIDHLERLRDNAPRVVVRVMTDLAQTKDGL